jgi:GntR family transcriptional regulator
MDIHEGHPLFLISSIMYTRDDSPLEYRKSFYRADKYKFHIKRQV